MTDIRERKGPKLMGYDVYACDDTGSTLPGDEHYFRRNIWGMGPLRDVLEELGMGYWSVLPDFPRDGTDDEAYAYLKNTFNEAPGIALHKFCDNSGWWVTRVECKSALEIWERHCARLKADGITPCVPDEFGDDFLPFLTRCADTGGMRVY